MIRLKKKIIIAVDGYSSCGKSSFAKLIAQQLDYLYLDSGAMYRAVALHGLQKGIISNKSIDTGLLIDSLTKLRIAFRKERGDRITLLNGEDVELQIRGVEVSSIVSEVSKIRQVREHLVFLQQEMGRQKAIVMDGRDIGTVVFPDAEIKIFMQANVCVRAQRRFEELKQKGIEASLTDITKNIEDRDYQDIHREISPLRKAADAHILDNSYMTFEEQMQWFIDKLKAKKLVDRID